ncbi:heavy metal-responsive transcriptional regulator [Nodularia sphaerocarpa]|uniref:heavy metal-responsive transcriptional regulator n=1 Tax=Nodularia sphaerocarpa TaxID=137816 RepID=UPI001EFC1816|nr:heavy metal-responsive transcriptional regulator [Nodularia sphaerocarpa]MDB9372144.1 heavy metal-responsive transcriptional regulator [Nodularia sphaerocarpa CS-585]MDB9380572.1 heavy metal-responsive transcriptional regulator [Nodularia sphaerocarpa CS-585A2]ULP70842.1 Mercuric resistance operon regulatory protein [Nodularia sphaerocarpa UHCC 0038]
MFKMGEVSRNLGINPQTLYFYERIGLIPPPQRTEAGYRLFSELDVDRLAFITRAKSLGLSLDDIKEILSLKEGKLLSCKAVYERLSQKVKDIEENISQLRSLHDELVPLVEQCKTNLDHPDPAYQCIILDAEL